MFENMHTLENFSGKPKQITSGVSSWHTILKDTTTNILYHYIDAANRCTLTPVIDADGKPVVYKPEE